MTKNRWMSDIQPKINGAAFGFTDSDLPVYLQKGPHLGPLVIEEVYIVWDNADQPRIVVKVADSPKTPLDTDDGDMIQYGAK